MDSDCQLLSLFAQGDQRAFTQLVERHSALVHRTAYRITQRHTLAEEATQLTFSVLAQHALKNRSLPQTLEGWLHKTASFTAMRALDKEVRHQQKLRHYRHHHPGPAEEAGHTELLPELDRALLRLGTRDREIIVLRFLKGYSIPEIARRLDGTEAAIQKRAHRAMGKLRQWLASKSTGLSAAALLALLESEGRAAIPEIAALDMAEAALSQSAKLPPLTVHQTIQNLRNIPTMIHDHRKPILTSAACATLVGIIVLTYGQAEEFTLTRVENVLFNGGSESLFAGAESGPPKSPIQYTLQGGIEPLFPGSESEATDASAFGSVFYARTPNILPYLQTSQTQVSLTTFGSNNGVPHAITDSGWISGRAKAPIIGAIWNGSTGGGWVYPGTNFLYAIAEQGGAITAVGKSSTGKLVKVTTTTTSPHAFTPTEYPYSGELLGVDPSGMYLGGGVAQVGGGYKAVLIDDADNLIQLPSLDSVIPWDFVYDVILVEGQPIAVGQANDAVNQAHAVIWFEGMKAMRLTDFVKLAFDPAPGSDLMDSSFKPSRAASIEKSPNGWVICGEGRHATTGLRDGWILELPRLVKSVSP